MWKTHDNAKKLQETKTGLKNAINECMTSVLKMLDDDVQYYENFAPSYNVMCEQYKEQEQLYNDNMKVLDGYNQYSSNLHKWLQSAGIEDADFEDITDDVDF